MIVAMCITKYVQYQNISQRNNNRLNEHIGHFKYILKC